MNPALQTLTLVNATAVALGGLIGCWLRWLLAVFFNAWFPMVPLGTLFANLSGGLMVGLAFGYISLHPDWPVFWRLFVITGFLGGLTTFSTFSLEAFVAIERGSLGWAAVHILLHLVGSIGFCAIGYFLFRSFSA